MTEWSQLCASLESLNFRVRVAVGVWLSRFRGYDAECSDARIERNPILAAGLVREYADSELTGIIYSSDRSTMFRTR